MKVTRRALYAVLGLALLAHGVAYAEIAGQKPKVFEGIITQMNLGDGSFVLRLRDGNTVTVKNPVDTNFFVSVKGTLDQTGTKVEKISSVTVKDPNASDAVPNILVMDPGSGTVTTKVTLTGTGFTKKNNSISIGGTPNAVVGIPSQNGKITFKIPSAPCNQKIKANCPHNVIAPGRYDIAVTNANGVSSPVAFQITPLPPLAMTTEIVPQAMGGTKYKIALSAQGGAESYSWRITDGKLPPGILLAQAACSDTPCRTDAILSGVPALPGTYTFTVTLTSGQEITSRQFTITVVQPLSNSW